MDNTSQANNHNAAVSDDMFNEIRAKLGKFGVRPSELVYVCDINTFIRSLSVGNFRTLDKFGPQATLLTGQLGAVEGIPVIVSEQMGLADTDGKVTDSGNGTDTGRLLIVNRSQWRVGFKRELAIETVRDAQKRQNIMVVSFRRPHRGPWIERHYRSRSRRQLGRLHTPMARINRTGGAHTDCQRLDKSCRFRAVLR